MSLVQAVYYGCLFGVGKDSPQPGSRNGEIEKQNTKMKYVIQIIKVKVVKWKNLDLPSGEGYQKTLLFAISSGL